jgi:LPXTG-motif cell wall-anchored protein
LIPNTGSPFTTGAIIGVGGIGLIGGGVVIRRWWIQRQNPALFREYD